MLFLNYFLLVSAPPSPQILATPLTTCVACVSVNSDDYWSGNGRHQDAHQQQPWNVCTNYDVSDASRLPVLLRPNRPRNLLYTRHLRRTCRSRFGPFFRFISAFAEVFKRLAVAFLDIYGLLIYHEMSDVTRLLVKSYFG